ncbi:ABC transporter substrate-binding protein [Saccharomonospora sp. CUA-673]|uniref:MCE family protein n=1 Tax=Saccharomonospora sp. CUA-673 TaxID=1904969 RepID=UPI00095B4DBA|nr:MCE family protein [Saccharomonospora sp. CUA-673]OLT48577.1 ABC transporter substrate-binding protein [Saccharomonospora sp. CUA-673]
MRSFVPALIKIGVFAAVTVLLTGILAATIANTNFGPSAQYTAHIVDASGLREGDDVRMSGVKIGQVQRIDVGEGEAAESGGDAHAEIHFDIHGERDLPGLVTATVKYRNLIGQRYLSLDAAVPESEPLEPGSTIPVERTQPALNLTVLFNGFQPLLRALEPEQVNQLSYEIIRVFQGEGGTVRSLLSHTASLTSTLAERDEVIGQTVDNLNQVLTTVNNRTPQVQNLLSTTQELVSGLAEQRKPIGEAVEGLGELTEATSGLLADAREPLRDDVAGLRDLAGGLADSSELIDEVLTMLPGHLNKFTRTVSYGSWFNYFLCDLSGSVGISSLNVELPILPLPATQMPERCQVE